MAGYVEAAEAYFRSPAQRQSLTNWRSSTDGSR